MRVCLPTVFCLLLLCTRHASSFANLLLTGVLGVNSTVDPYGLDYYITVGGELTAVFFGPAGKIAAITPLLTDAGELLLLPSKL